jgi:hypothetical protein
MIGRIIGYSLYYGLGVGSAVLAMVTVLPSVRLDSRANPTHVPGAEHAVLVSGQHGGPVTAGGGMTSGCPYLAAVAAESSCPYLSALAAGSGCPSLTAVSAASRCPALRDSGGSAGCPALGHPRIADPRAAEPQLPEGASPELTDPATGWKPPGTVLARLDGTSVPVKNGRG